MGTQAGRRCVVIAAGEIKDYEPLRAMLRGDDFILCADAGTRHAEKLGVTPHLVIGDFDSSAGPPADVPFLTFPAEKDETDTILCLQHALGKGFRRFLILGGFGGRLDHTLANFSALFYLIRHGAEGVMADAGCEALVVENGKVVLPRRAGWYVSVFPLNGPAHGVYERGLKYTLDDATLLPEFPLGVSNRFEDAANAEISVREGTLLILLAKADTFS